MTSPPSTQKLRIGNSALAIGVCAIVLIALVALLWNLFASAGDGVFTHVSTVAGTGGQFGETFGIAVKGRDIYIADGRHGKVWRVVGGETQVFADGLHTPSAIAFDDDGNLIVADSGTHTIKSINSSGQVSTIAGAENRSGFADGDTGIALFNAPIGVAVDSDTVYVADTYNDRIRVIENGKVTTLADKNFDTPTGLAIWRDKLLVADTGNHRIRVVERDGSVWTLAGNGDGDIKNGSLLSSSFVQPTAVVVDKNGRIFVADGNAIRQISLGVISTVRTITDEQRGLRDGDVRSSRFNRPSGLTVDRSGDLLVADSENRLVRRLSVSKSGHEIGFSDIEQLDGKVEDFRNAAPPRWPFDPPDAKRDIAGTLGEIRGFMTEGSDQVWFHNGLDIAGAYGETARSIRDEKVLRPMAVENFGSLRELIRMPKLGYIHLRLGRAADDTPFGDTRFLFSKSAAKIDGVRVPRGAEFKAGDPIGTLNAMNHVHLIAGRSGSEMNALDALSLPNLSDTRPPTIEKVTLFDENKREIETTNTESRINLSGKISIIARAFDQVDGNPERRRLGVYKLGYQLLKSDGLPMSKLNWTITFDRLPPPEAVAFVYASGSKSGATGETIFDYIVTNSVNGDEFRKGLFDTTMVENGSYTLRVFAADYFGNETHKDLKLEILR